MSSPPSGSTWSKWAGSGTELPSSEASRRVRSPGLGSPKSPLSPTQPQAQPQGAKYLSTSSPARASSPDGPEDIERQVAEWDDMMESLDKKQEQLLNDQWRLLRTQIGSLMGALSQTRAELDEVKAKLAGSEVEAILERMMSAHDEHGKNHYGLIERVTFLETSIGESAEKHATELADTKGIHLDHQASMDTRLEFLEGLIGDSADKHGKELEAAHNKLQDLHGAISECAKSEHHDSMEKRVDYLEKFLGESADKQEKELNDSKSAHLEHKTTMETRLEYLEGLLGDSADRHSQAITDANTRLQDLHAAVALCANSESHSTLEQRMEYIEKFLGESFDKHSRELAEHRDHTTQLFEHKTSMEARLVYVENLLGDCADKHSKEIEDAKGRLGDLRTALDECAKVEHHNTLEQRMDYLEKFLGESADQHDKDLANHKSTADQHERDLANHRSTADQHEKDLANQKSAHLEHKATMEARLEYLEALIGDSADKHSKEIEAAKLKLGDLHSALESCAKAEHHSSLEQRINYLESFLGESADKHEKELADCKSAHLEHKTTMESRLEYIEGLLGDSADKHAKEIEEANAKLGNLHAALDVCANRHAQDFTDHINEVATHKSAVEATTSDLGRRVTSIQDRQFTESEATKAKLKELQGRLGACEALFDKFKIAIEDRCDHIESKARDCDDSHNRKVSSLETGHLRLRSTYDELSSVVRSEKASRDVNKSSVDAHLAKLETVLTESIEKQMQELDYVQVKLQDTGSKVDQVRASHEGFKAHMEQRLHHVENTEQSAEILREVDQRLHYLQEDQKRARDVLESSFVEQLRLEHSTVHSQSGQIKEQWDREMKARKAYQDSYKDLLGQERAAREVTEKMAQRRVDELDRSTRSEVQRLWQALEGLPVPTPSHRPEKVTQATTIVSPRTVPVLGTQTFVKTRQVTPTTRMISAPVGASVGNLVDVVGSSAPVGTGSWQFTGRGSVQCPAVPMATAAVGTNRDGQPIIFTGVDMNRDGIPDALQVTEPVPRLNTNLSMSLARTSSMDGNAHGTLRSSSVSSSSVRLKNSLG